MDRVRTVGDGRDEAISGNWTVIDHSFGHGLLSHEIARRDIRTCERMMGETYLSTRASDVRPAIAMPT